MSNPRVKIKLFEVGCIMSVPNKHSSKTVIKQRNKNVACLGLS